MLRQREVSPFLSILELDGVNLDPIHGFLKVVSITVSLPPLSFLRHITLLQPLPIPTSMSVKKNWSGRLHGAA